jgi:hypothetical protein
MLTKLKPLAKKPIYVDNIPIYSPLLIDIAEIGHNEYLKHLGLCTISKERLSDKIENINNIADYDILLHCIITDNLVSDYLKSLTFFTHIEFKLMEKDNDILFYRDNYMLNRSNYLQFIKTVKYLNCLDVEDEEELDEFDRRVKEAEKKIREAQSENGERIEFADLISSVTNMDGNDLNILNIWDLNIFQLYDQFQRGQLKEGYRLGIKQLLAGAKAEDVQLEHYIKTIN